MQRRLVIFLILAVGLFVWRPSVSDPFVFDKIHDVQILVDVTSNTAQTDPKRHRVEAVRLLVDLLPEGSYATLWELAEKPQLLYPQSVVNDDWREEASDATLGLHAKSRGIDLEAALKAATSRWTERDPEFERSLILFMDNEQGVHLGDEKKAVSRKAIMDTWIPQLARLGVKVYSIALSGKADTAMLEALALQTSGWYKQSGRASGLSHLVLDLFEKMTAPAILPMQSGSFRVDEEVEAFSLILFHPKPQVNLQLKSPQGKSFTGSAKPVSAAAQKVSWRKTKAYDLIHVTNPVPGQWKMTGNRHPDSRLIVQSSINLNATLLPSQIYQGERFAFEAYVTRNDVAIKDPEELSRLDITLSLAGSFAGKTITLKDDGEMPDRVSGDGVFAGIMSPQKPRHEGYDAFSDTQVRLADRSETGSVMLVTQASLGAIERQVQQKIHVLPVVPRLETESSWLNNVGVYTVNYSLQMPEVKQESLSLYAKVRRNDGKVKLHHLTKLPSGGWQVHFEDEPDKGPFTIDWRLKGQTAAGRYIVIDLPSSKIDEVPPPPVIQEVVPQVSAPELVAQKEVAGFNLPFKQLFFVLVVLNLLYIASMYWVKTWLESQRRIAGEKTLSRLFEEESK